MEEPEWNTKNRYLWVSDTFSSLFIWLRINSMLAQPVLTHLLPNSLSVVSHKWEDNDSERWKYGHLKRIEFLTHCKKCLRSKAMMFKVEEKHSKQLLKESIFHNQQFQSHSTC